MDEPAELVETLLALEFLSAGRGGPEFAPWRAQVIAAPSTRALFKLAPALRPRLGVYDIVRRANGLEGAVEGQLSDADSRIAKEVREFHRHAIAPYWQRIAGRLAVDRAARGQIMLSGGMEKVLSTLHSAVRWESPVLDVPGMDVEVKLGDDGLLLAPSLFLHSRPPILLKELPGFGMPVLIYPIPVKQKRMAGMWSDGPAREKALGALLGRTRAAVLRALADSCSTTELGARVGISMAAASQHAGILRSAGLVTTVRSFNTVTHTLTPLGNALLYEELIA
ncbi:ArsR/SmtB family transcription factor [Streptomyces sp. NPDC006691]|uniref:ArsR/SmtB family transcription factor n=1 Tax=Streptomyces sp. NPDC006691 TaxID=3364757 RepID=UPI003684E809